MNALMPLSTGFTDPVQQAQSAFRAALDALSRPGQRVCIGAPVPGVSLGSAMAHLLLTLTDDDTPVWWQHADASAAQWLRFHTSAPLAATPTQAAFAVLTAASSMPALESFALGCAASPEFSTTLLLEVPSLDSGTAMEWSGPGIREPHTVRINGLPDPFWTQWQANHALFPQGVDIVFCCADAALGLPRTTRVRRLEGI